MKSLLYVPSTPKMLNKIFSSEADGFLIDLEDSIKEDDKKQALEDAFNFIKDNPNPNKEFFVRVAGNHIEEEVEKLNGLSFRGYMIPKFEKVIDYEKYKNYLSCKDVIALVETPLGLINIKEIASCSFVTMLSFGAEDFTSAIGMKNCTDTLNYAKSTLVTYGKAFHKPVYDTPSFIINDDTALHDDIQSAVDLGFDGKCAIHPKQVKIINELFKYYDLETIKKVIKQYEDSGKAVLQIGDKVFEKMHIAHYKRILKEHGIQ